MTSEFDKKSSTFTYLLSLSGFIFLLYVFYFCFVFLFVFTSNSIGFTTLRYLSLFFAVNPTNPYIIFLSVLLALQWFRWLYALYQKQGVKLSFVENYFLPLLYGSACHFFILLPIYFLISTLKIVSFSFWVLPFSFLFCGLIALPLLFPLLILVSVTGRFARPALDPRLVYWCFVTAGLTGIINFFTYKQADTIDAFLCDFIYIGLDTVILVAVIFFKGAELIIRQFLTHDFKPKHTVFAFPVWVLVVIYCYLRLLEAMDFLCFVL